MKHISQLKSFLLIQLFSFMLLVPFSTNAMIQKQSPKALIQNSELIVEAIYIGQQEIVINEQKSLVDVLHVTKTLKGSEHTKIYIQIPKTPVSDYIELSQNQSGLWLFEKDKTLGSLFKLNNPQRIIATAETQQFIDLINQDKTAINLQ